MPKDGWEKVEFTASEDLVLFIDQWQARRQLKTRAAVRDLIELAKKQLEDPQSTPVTKQDLTDLRNELRRLSGLPPKK